jgi:hypothetical protein
MAIYTQEAATIHGESPLNIFVDDVRQIYSDTCAIKSQELILKEFGYNISEDQLVQEAMNNGWYQPGGGTSPANVGKLLELHGIPVAQYENANIFNLVNELAQGHKVIVGVDSGELWNNGFLENMEDKITGEQADHALLVSGIDTTDPNNVKVIVTDPGSGDYCREYSMDQFIDAWQDSNCFMVTTQNAVPNIFEPFAQLNFTDITSLPTIGYMPYDLFYNDLAFLNYTYQIPPYIFDDFSNFVGGDINMFSPNSLDFLNSLDAFVPIADIDTNDFNSDCLLEC